MRPRKRRSKPYGYLRKELSEQKGPRQGCAWPVQLSLLWPTRPWMIWFLRPHLFSLRTAFSPHQPHWPPAHGKGLPLRLLFLPSHRRAERKAVGPWDLALHCLELGRSCAPQASGRGHFWRDSWQCSPAQCLQRKKIY